MKSITLELLNYSYSEHFKAEKDLSLILPIDHPKRKSIRDSLNDILLKIHEITDKL